MVMCREPLMRTPWSGFSWAYLRRMAIRPGISYSATEISLRPQSAKERSATLKSTAVESSVAVPIKAPLVSRNLDTLILDDLTHGVNPQSAAPRRRPEPAPHPAPARAGGVVRLRASGGSLGGPEPDLDAPGAVEASRSGGRPAHGQECLLPSDGARGADGRAAAGGRRGARSGDRSRGAPHHLTAAAG